VTSTLDTGVSWSMTLRGDVTGGITDSKRRSGERERKVGGWTGLSPAAERSQKQGLSGNDGLSGQELSERCRETEGLRGLRRRGYRGVILGCVTCDHRQLKSSSRKGG